MNHGSAVSDDGTVVEYQTCGRGAPVVVVPGTLVPCSAFLGLAQRLAERRLVVLVERRGYGATAPGTGPGGFERQVEDLLAVLRRLPRPVTLFGHSFGGLISLGAALADESAVGALRLYEPPVMLLGDVLAPVLDRCRKLIDDGRLAAAVEAALPVAGPPPAGAADVRPEVTERLVPLLPGLVLDLECAVAMRMPPGHWGGSPIPLTLLRGELSADEHRRGIDVFRTLYPDARCEVLPGQAHLPRDMSVLAPFLTARPNRAEPADRR